MCDQTHVDYKPGDVVWVKLSNIWWPGEVQDQTQLDEEVTSGLRKEPLAVVKFFDEDSYEFPKNLDQIYRYNCLKKDEFIKKGLDLFRASTTKTTSRSIPSSIEKFPRDVVTAETLVKGDPNYIHHPKFAMGTSLLMLKGGESNDESPAKMIKLDDDDDDDIDSDIVPNFASPPKVTFNMPSKGSTPRNKSKKKSLNTTVTPLSILKKKRPDHSLYDLADPKYFCIMCKNFVSRHRSVIFSHFFLHYTGELQPRPPVIPARYENQYISNSTVATADPPKSQEKRKRKKPAEDPTPKKSEVVNDDAEASTSTSTSQRKRNKKVKIVHEPDESNPPIALDILQDWQDSDDEESTATKTKRSEDKPLPAESINSTKTDEVSTSPAKSMTSCFDFEDNEDSLNVDGALKFGQKLPRVLNEKQSSNRMRTNSRTEDISEDFSKQIDSFLETTDIPNLPLIPQALSTDASGHKKISVTSEKKNSTASPTLSEIGVKKNTDKKKPHFTYHSTRKSTSEENESVKKKNFDVVNHNYSRSQSTNEPNQNHPSNSELSCEPEEEPEENKARRKSLRSAPKTIEVDISTEDVEIDKLSKENIPDINESLSETSEKPVSGLMLPTLEAGDAESFPTPQQTSKEKDIQINEKYKNITDNSEINSDLNNSSSLKSDEESTMVDKEINNSPGHFLCIDDVKTKPPEIPQHHMNIEEDKSLKKKSDSKAKRVSNTETNEREKHDRKVKDKYSQESDKKQSNDKQRIAKAKTETSGKLGKEREHSSRRNENEQKLSKHSSERLTRKESKQEKDNSSERLTRKESRKEKDKSTHRSSNNDAVKPVKNETERSSRNDLHKSVLNENSNPTKRQPRLSILSETSNPTKRQPRLSILSETSNPTKREPRLSIFSETSNPTKRQPRLSIFSETSNPTKREPRKSIVSETSNLTKREPRKSIVSETSNPTKREPRKSIVSETSNPTKREPRKSVLSETSNPTKREPRKSVLSETSNPTKNEPRKSVLSETSNPTKNEPHRSTRKETDRPESGRSRKNETNRSTRSRSESDRSARNELETSTRSRSDKRTKSETERSKKHSTERPGKQDSGKHESERTSKHSVEKTMHHDGDKTKRHEKERSEKERSRRRSEAEEKCGRQSKHVTRKSSVNQEKKTNHKEEKLSNLEDESSRNKLEKKDKLQHLNDARDKIVKHEKNVNISSEKSNYETLKKEKRSKSKMENKEFKKQKVSHGESVSLTKMNNDNVNTLNEKLLLSLDHNNSSHEVSNLKYNENDSMALEREETCSSELVVNRNLHATEENSTINETEIRLIAEPSTVYNKVTFAEVISPSEQNACSGIATKQDDNHEINLGLKSLSEISVVQGTPDKTKNLLKDDKMLPEQQMVVSNESPLKNPDTSYHLSSSFEESLTASLEPSPNLSDTSKHLSVSPKQCSLLETLTDQTPRPSETLEQQFCLISPQKSSFLQTSFDKNSSLSEIRNESIGQITSSEVISLSQASSSPTTPIKSFPLEASCELGPSPSVYNPIPDIPSKQYLSPEAFLEEMQSQSESSEPPILVTPSNQHAIPEASPRKNSIHTGSSDQFPSSTSTLKETLETCQEQTSSLLECSDFLSREPETLNRPSKLTSYEENTSSLSEPMEHLPCISTPLKQDPCLELDIEQDSSSLFGTPKSLPIQKESLELSPSLSTPLKEAVCTSIQVDSSVSSVELNTNVSPPGISSITPPQLNKSLEISEKVNNNMELSNIEVLSSQSDGLFSAQDMDLDIKNMPIEIESDIEANQLPLMEICVGRKPFDSIPGVKVFHVILRRNGEPFPKQIDSVEKNILKFDKKSEDDNDDSGFQKRMFPIYKPEHDIIFKEAIDLHELSPKKPGPVSNPSKETPTPVSNLPKETPTSKPRKEISVPNSSVSSDKPGSVSTVIPSSVATSGFSTLPLISFPNKGTIGQGTIVLDMTGNTSKVNNSIISTLYTQKNSQILKNFKVVPSKHLVNTSKTVSIKPNSSLITGKTSGKVIIATNQKQVRIPTSLLHQQTQQKCQTVGFCPKMIRKLSFTEKTPTLVKSKSRNVLFNGNKIQIAPQAATNSRRHSTEKQKEKEKEVETTYESKSIHRSPNILQKKSKRPINPGSTSKVVFSNSQIVESTPGVSAQPVLQPTSAESVIYLTVDEQGNYHPSDSSISVPIQRTIKGDTGTILSNPSSKILRLSSAKKIVKPAGQDILAEALANTQVLQSDIEGAEFIDADFSQTSLRPAVLETSLTLNQPPIMSPLEVPSVMSSLTSKTQTIFISDNSTFQLSPIVVSQAGTSSVEPKYIISGIEPSKPVVSRLDKDNILPEFLKGDFTKKTNKSRKSFGDR